MSQLEPAPSSSTRLAPAEDPAVGGDRSGRRGPARWAPPRASARPGYGIHDDQSVERRCRRRSPRRGRPGGSRSRGRRGTTRLAELRGRRPGNRRLAADSSSIQVEAIRLAHSPTSSIQHRAVRRPRPRGCWTQVEPSVTSRSCVGTAVGVQVGPVHRAGLPGIFGRFQLSPRSSRSAVTHSDRGRHEVRALGEQDPPAAGLSPSRSRATSVLTGASGSVWSSRMA